MSDSEVAKVKARRAAKELEEELGLRVKVKTSEGEPRLVVVLENEVDGASVPEEFQGFKVTT